MILLLWSLFTDVEDILLLSWRIFTDGEDKLYWCGDILFCHGGFLFLMKDKLNKEDILFLSGGYFIKWNRQYQAQVEAMPMTKCWYCLLNLLKRRINLFSMSSLVIHCFYHEGYFISSWRINLFYQGFLFSHGGYFILSVRSFYFVKWTPFYVSLLSSPMSSYCLPW